MKKHILIFGILLSAIGLIAFSWMHSTLTENEPETEFIYMIDSEFGATVTKENLHKAMSVNDVLPEVADWEPYPIHFVKLTIFKGKQALSESSENIILSEAQKQLLKTVDYSEGFHFKAKSKGVHKKTGEPANCELNYSITVTPEKEAEYVGGMDAVILYLENNSKKETSIAQEDQLNRGQIKFIVSKEGTVTNVELLKPSGYDSIDNHLLTLINSLPESWTPASTLDGEKIEQEFIFSFGRGGC
jgi:protein TonB